ncbi:MAG: hypothetical protein BWZ03_00790 [bacterium ADurb.BinA186]|nr:MAG: hypothetical protein BWZ03_00790 [bacterium ADurb.BinA186]
MVNCETPTLSFCETIIFKSAIEKIDILDGPNRTTGNFHGTCPYYISKNDATKKRNITRIAHNLNQWPSFTVAIKNNPIFTRSTG